MNPETLCNKIALQKEIQKEVLHYMRSEEFSAVRPLIEGLKHMGTEEETRKKLKQHFQTDAGQLKMLSCMLACAVDLYQWYIEKGISPDIFFETMGCFPRFINECRQITGAYAFDREWWTARQISGNLFRIGELEYETKYSGDTPVISIHIPSDAVLTSKNCSRSIADARLFFTKYFEEYANADYICHSWLLAPELSVLLPKTSNILAFQSRFVIQKVDYGSFEYRTWVFQTNTGRISDFPEKTTLQKNMKHYLLNGGKIGTGLGLLSKF